MREPPSCLTGSHLLCLRGLRAPNPVTRATRRDRIRWLHELVCQRTPEGPRWGCETGTSVLEGTALARIVENGNGIELFQILSRGGDVWSDRHRLLRHIVQ
jgi:hypothetical protein